MNSHNEGEVWGLTQCGSDVLTTGDDNRCIRWDTAARKCKGEVCITTDQRKAPRGGASSQSHKPASQQSRAVCVFAGNVVTAMNDGCVRARDMNSMQEVKVVNDSKEWIQVL